MGEWAVLAGAVIGLWLAHAWLVARLLRRVRVLEARLVAVEAVVPRPWEVDG